jgi:hypothetical protein
MKRKTGVSLEKMVKKVVDLLLSKWKGKNKKEEVRSAYEGAVQAFFAINNFPLA